MTLKNAKDHLEINVLSKNDQVTHPSVIDFKTEHGIDKWAGYRYWMACTPYAYGNDRFENPCLCTSNDGLAWDTPAFIQNPLDKAPGGLKLGFHSDPDMIYNPVTDELMIYYRYVNNNLWRMKLLCVNAKGEVTGPKTLAELSPRNRIFRSQAIWRESDTKWHMWGGIGPAYTIKSDKPCSTVYLSSTDGINWAKPVLCTNSENIDPFVSVGYSNWHIAAKPNPKRGKVEFLCYCHKIHGGKNALIFAECDCDKPTEISCSVSEPVLEQSDSGWDSKSLYRCSFVRDDDSIKIWYAGTTKKKLWQRVFRHLFLLNKYLPVVYKLHTKWYIGYVEEELKI